jgi:FKBP-type peptidyl-prolyl cis-trans isomerase
VKKYYESKTPRWQRLAIWVIAVAMLGGTILTYVVILIANDNADANPTQIAYNKYLEEQKKAQEEAMKEQAEAEAKYVMFDDAYADKITEYDSGSISELRVETLKEGDGETVTENDVISANYTGWGSDGRIFDTTRKEAGADVTPVEFWLKGVIAGWTQGLPGKKVGGVYLLEIPSNLAYGDDASTGQPTGALKFVVEIESIVDSGA